jgi:phage terminase large subunit-like protein
VLDEGALKGEGPREGWLPFLNTHRTMCLAPKPLDPRVSFKSVHASRGKVVRAEPIAALYEQRKVHHVGNFSTLEDQMCAFTSDFDCSRNAIHRTRSTRSCGR